MTLKEFRERLVLMNKRMSECPGYGFHVRSYDEVIQFCKKWVKENDRVNMPAAMKHANLHWKTLLYYEALAKDNGAL